MPSPLDALLARAAAGRGGPTPAPDSPTPGDPTPNGPAALLDAALDLADDAAGCERVAATAFALGDLPRSERALLRAHALASAPPSFLTSGRESLLLTRIGALRVRLGRLPEAEEALRAALALSDEGYASLQLGNALRYAGRPSEAATLLADALAAARAQRDGGLAIAALCALGELELDRLAAIPGTPPEESPAAARAADPAGGAPPRGAAGAHHASAQTAVERFGEALGITEHAGDPALTVAPLAGLAHAHALWRVQRHAQPRGRGPHAHGVSDTSAPSSAPDGKPAALARRALARAESAGDAPGVARALWALGVALHDAATLAAAAERAAAAPHRPLWLRCRLALLRLLPDAGGPDARAELRRAAAEMGVATPPDAGERG